MILKFLFLSLTLFAVPLDHTYFRLHQATAYLEAYINKKCPHGVQYADELLRHLSSDRAEKFSTQIKELRKLRKNIDEVKVVQVETLRFDIHQVAEKLKLPHDDHWHIDAASCHKVKMGP